MKLFTRSLFLVSSLFLFIGNTEAQIIKSKFYLGNRLMAPRSITTSTLIFDQSDLFKLTNERQYTRWDEINIGTSMSLGYFASNRILMRTDIAYSALFTEEFRYDLFNLGVAIRYYYKPGDSQNNFFSEIGASHFWGEGFLENILSAEVGLGVSRLLAPSLVFEGQLNYHRNDLLNGDNGNYLFSLGIGLLLGKEDRESPAIAPSLTKGTIMLGANSLRFGIFRQDQGFGHALNLQPNVLYFITDKLALGAEIYFGYDRITTLEIEIISTGETFKGYRTNVQVGGTPIIRYQTQNNSRLRYYLEAGLAYSFLQVTRDNSFLEQRVEATEKFQPLLKPAVSYFITEQATLELGPEFRYDKQSQKVFGNIELGFKALLSNH